jgi:hypothetical protein
LARAPALTEVFVVFLTTSCKCQDLCAQVLGDLEEFENAVQLVLRDVSFDNDVVVSVFETNIRVLGYV